MKLVIFGASGQTGKELVRQALEAGHEVVAFLRRPGSLAVVHPNLKVMVGQFDDYTKLLEAITGADACLSALGGNSLTNRSLEFTSGIDSILTVMDQTGVSRFIYLSSVGAGDSRYYMGPLIRLFIVGILLRVPLADHGANEKRIAKSGLEWTIVRPISLSNGEKTGNYRHGTEFTKLVSNAKVSRADVAGFMLGQLASGEYIRKSPWLLS